MDEERRSRMPVVVVAVVLVILPTLYVLAIGPLNQMVNTGIIENESPLCLALRMIYLPVIFVAENCEPVGSVLAWYLKLWE